MRMHAAKRLGRRGAERVLDGGGAHPALEALLRDAARLPDGPLRGEQTALVQFRSRRLVEGWSPTATPVRTPRRFRRPALGVASLLAAGVATTVAIGAVALVSGSDSVPGLPGLSGRQQPAGALADQPTTTSSGTRAPSTTSSSDAPGQTPRSISPSQLVQLVQPCTTFLVALQQVQATASATAVGPTGSYHTDANNDGNNDGSGDQRHRSDSHHRRHHSPVHHPANPAPPTPQAPPVLVEAAGGADKVPAFCAALVTNSPSQPATTPTSPTSPSTVPSSTSSTSPSNTQTGYRITSYLGEPPG